MYVYYIPDKKLGEEYLRKNTVITDFSCNYDEWTRKLSRKIDNYKKKHYPGLQMSVYTISQAISSRRWVTFSAG